jgi:hypothetical protein
MSTKSYPQGGVLLVIAFFYSNGAEYDTIEDIETGWKCDEKEEKPLPKGAAT